MVTTILTFKLTDGSKAADNRRFGNMAGRRIYPHRPVRYHLQSGLDFYY